MSIFKNNKNYFIIASPRSGTTWLSNMLNAHNDVFCVERRLFGIYADFVKDQCAETPRLRVTLDKYIQSMLLHHGMPKNKEITLTKAILKTIELQERKLSGKNIIIDKITPYLNSSEVVLNQINTYFPKSKLVFLVRDGRDVITSGVFHWFNKKQTSSKLSDFEIKRRQIFKDNPESKLDRFFQDKEIKQWANEWVQPLQIIEKAKKKHHVKIVYYEDMLNETQNVLKTFFSFLSIKTNNAIIDTCVEAGSFSNMSQGRRQGKALQGAHVRKGVSGDWKNFFTHQDAILFNEIAGDMLLKFGYERNKDWVERVR